MASWRDNAIFGVFAMVWAVFTVFLTVVAILLGAPFLGPHRSFWLIGPMWFRQFAVVCGIDWEVKGWEHLPEDIRSGKQPAIFMGNHESQLDPPFLIAAIPIPSVYIAKKEVKLIPMVGWAAMCAGAIFIDRSNRERAVKSLHRAAKEIHDGKSVSVFPEGTRTRTGELLPFKKGSFVLAQDAEVPIVPFGIHGAYGILPPGTRRVRPGKYTLTFGTPVDPSAYEDRDALVEAVRSQVLELRKG